MIYHDYFSLINFEPQELNKIAFHIFTHFFQIAA
jgi:hypothetical protein